MYHFRREFTCCLSARPLLYIWLHTKIPIKSGSGYDRADGHPFILYTTACQTDDATGVTRCPSWIKARSQVFPSTFPHQPLSLYIYLSQFNLFLIPTSLLLLSLPSPLAYLKPKITWLHSQAR